MDRLTERIEVAERALATLAEVAILTTPTTAERDAAILRFQYSFEAIWKTAKQFLAEIEGVEIGSPKAAIRACRDADLLQDRDSESALAMADDRNLAVHTYNEALARALYARLGDHLTVLTAWLAAMRAGV